MTAKVLIRAAELIEQGWTRGCSSRDGFGVQVMPWDDSATRWCAVGALTRALLDVHGIQPRGHGYEAVGSPAYSALCRTIGRATLVDWNDEHGRTADEVAAALRAAAASLER